MSEIKVFGCDISHWQGTHIPFDTLKNDGVSFIIHKATDGKSGIDVNYAVNIQKIKDAGMTAGAYHFYEPGISGDTQANHFMDIVGDEDCKNIILALDFEKYALNTKPDIINAELFIDTVLEKYPEAKLLFYSYHNFTSTANLDENSSIRKCKQWIARYSSQLPYINYKEPLFVWQQSQSYKFEGGGQDFDYDIVMANNDEWNQFINPPKIADSGNDIHTPENPEPKEGTIS